MMGSTCRSLLNLSRTVVNDVVFGPGRRIPKATVVVVLVLVLVVVVISSLKIPKAFVIRSGAQRNFAHTFLLTFSADLPSQIFT